MITWFQNRRAKLKRDMEELKKDMQTAKLVAQAQSVYHSTKGLFEPKLPLYDSIQDLSMLKSAELHLMQSAMHSKTP